MKKKLISIINKLPYVRGLYKENKILKKNSLFPAGHFYSPIVNPEEINKREKEIWKDNNEKKLGLISLNSEFQLNLLTHLNAFYSEMPFQKKKHNGLRYYFENKFYSYTDAIILYSLIRHFEPKHIIEIGSGFSSALMLDVNQLFFKNKINTTFIDPNPERLYSILNTTDENLNIIAEEVQSINPLYFKQLEAGDILFVDSSHISKTGSDLNFVLFEIIPILESGVIIHFHDIFYPFEYPKTWVYEGRNWNENYLLKAFLMGNNEFEILFFSHYMHEHFPAAFKFMPLCYKNPGGNLWLKKK